MDCSIEIISKIIHDKTLQLMIESIVKEYPGSKVTVQNGVATLDIPLQIARPANRIELQGGVYKDVLID